MKHRIRDVFIEVAIAIALVCLILLYAAHGPRDSRLAFRWVGPVLFTAVAFGYPLQAFRPYWKRLAFWVPIGILFGLHLAGYVVLLRGIDSGSAILALVTIIEVQVIVAVVRRVIKHYDTSEAGPRPFPS